MHAHLLDAIFHNMASILLRRLDRIQRAGIGQLAVTPERIGLVDGNFMIHSSRLPATKVNSPWDDLKM
jgi:hypothetical protein